MSPGSKSAAGPGFASRLHRFFTRPPLLENWALLLLALGLDLLVVLALWLGYDLERHELVVAHLAFFSLTTFSFFGLDKLLALRSRRRVAERNLLGLAFLGGAVGGLLGMVLFRHKTRGLAFRFLVPVAAIVNVCLVAVLLRH